LLFLGLVIFFFTIRKIVATGAVWCGLFDADYPIDRSCPYRTPLSDNWC
jgi:hypothetical protein